MRDRKVPKHRQVGGGWVLDVDLKSFFDTKWLDRRSQRGWLTWDRFNALLDRYRLPPALLRPGARQLSLANL